MKRNIIYRLGFIFIGIITSVCGVSIYDFHYNALKWKNIVLLLTMDAMWIYIYYQGDKK